MASEAQRLIGISLTKIAQSRAHRSGVSLHKNLLVATVLQKARFIFMEEAYNMVHYHHQAPAPNTHAAKNGAASDYNRDELVGLTAEEAGIESLPETVRETAHLQCVKCSENQDKDNNNQGGGELVYLDLDKTQRGNSCLKRRCAVTDWETEEAVQSILPKRSRCSSNNTNTTSSSSSSSNTEEGDDSVFLDEAAILSDAVTKELETKRNQQNNNSSTPTGSSAMEIDRITSLVSIFSFGGGIGGEGGKITRSVSTPDLCSAQAKDVVGDVLQQQRPPFIAMTV